MSLMDRLSRRRLKEIEAQAVKDLHGKNPRIREIIACQLHLLDLKRAGHSPTKTELVLPNGR